MTDATHVNPYVAGRAAYEADTRANPFYKDGKPRPRWPLLDTIVRGQWARGANRVTQPQMGEG